MKSKIFAIFYYIRDHQQGLFRIAIIVILLYWTMLFKHIIDYTPDTSGIESKLDQIDTTLRDRN